MISDELLRELLAFRNQRDWEQFHTPRNLSVSLAVEVAELLEQFRWAHDSDLPGIVERNREKIEQEVADVAILLSYLCHDLRISLEDSVRKKLAINERNYPLEKARGSSAKYDQL